MIKKKIWKNRDECEKKRNHDIEVPMRYHKQQQYMISTYYIIRLISSSQLKRLISNAAKWIHKNKTEIESKKEI